MAITDDRKAEIRAHLERDGYQEWQIAAFIRFEDEGRHGKAQRVLNGRVCGALRHKNRGRCLATPLPGRRRCRLHGGLALGPTTEAGRKAIGEANRAHQAAWRAAGRPPESEECRARRRAGAARRWAAVRRKKEMQERHRQRMAALGFTTSGRKYELSDEGREAIAAAQRRRWIKWREQRSTPADPQK